MATLNLRFSAALALSLVFAACAVDDRALQARPPSDISGTGGSGGTGVTTSIPEGGAAGDDGSDGEGLIDGCADLDTDGVPDCEATLVRNPTFTSDVEGWTALGQSELTWQPENALGDLPSGSAELTTESETRASAYQCVPVEGAELAIAYANVFVELGDDAEKPSQPQLEVTFFRGDGCSGVSDGYFDTPETTLAGEWTFVHAGGQSKDTTKSASIALVGLRTQTDTRLSIYFDNVMLKVQPLSP